MFSSTGSIDYVGHDGLTVPNVIQTSSDRTFTDFIRPLEPNGTRSVAYDNVNTRGGTGNRAFSDARPVYNPLFPPPPTIPPVRFPATYQPTLLHTAHPSQGTDQLTELRNTFFGPGSTYPLFGGNIANVSQSGFTPANPSTETIYILPQYFQSASATQALLDRGKTIEQIVCAFISNLENDIVNVHMHVHMHADSSGLSMQLTLGQLTLNPPQRQYRMLKSTLVFPSAVTSNEMMRQVISYTNRGRTYIREADDDDDESLANTNKIFNSARKIDAYVEQVVGSIHFTIEYLLISRSLHPMNMYRP